MPPHLSLAGKPARWSAFATPAGTSSRVPALRAAAVCTVQTATRHATVANNTRLIALDHTKFRVTFPHTGPSEPALLRDLRSHSMSVSNGGDADSRDDRDESPFLEINERVDVGEALIVLATQLERLPDYRYAWRWACAALHAAVQAAIVVSIAGSARIGAMRVKDQAKWMTACREGRWRDLPDERSDDFLPLYRRMKEQTGF